MEVVEARLEAGPGISVGDRVGNDPDAEHVVDVATKEKQVVAELTKESGFPDGVEKGCVGRSRRGSHSTPRNLFPAGVAELDHIVIHDQLQGVD